MNDIMVIEAITGNEEMLFELILEIKDSLYKIAYSYLKNEEDALEAIQETSYRAFLNIKKLKKPEFFKTWITRILINYCCDELKRKKKIYPLDRSKDVGCYIEDNSESIVLKNYIHTLGDIYKEVIILKYFEEYTIKEISYLLKIPEGTIKTRLSRGLSKLERKLNGGGFYE